MYPLGLIFGSAFKFDYFFNHSLQVALALIFGIALHGLKRYRASFCIGGFILCASALAQLFVRGAVMGDFLLQAYIAERWLIVVLGTVLFTELTYRIVEAQALGLICFINCLLTLFMHYFVEPYYWVGMFDNNSVNSAFIAILIPYLRVWQLPFALWILLLEPARAPWLMLAAYVIIPFPTMRRAMRNWKIAFAVSCAVVAMAIWKSSMKDFAYTDRWQVLSRGLTYWWEQGYIWFGKGIGSWFVDFPRLQKQQHYLENYFFTTAHNDFAQLLYETGIVGLVAFLWIVVDSLWIAGKQMPPAFFSLIGLTIFACFFFPLEMPALTFLWVFLIQRQLRRKSDRR